MNQARTVSYLTEKLLVAAGNALAHRQGGNRMCVINYHRVLASKNPLVAEPDVATFSWQMELLARCFNVLPLHDGLSAWSAGRLPPRAVCITFDDGYRSLHDLALPVLRTYRLPATVFVTSGHIDEGNMWNDRIIDAIQVLPNGTLDLDAFGLGSYPLQNVAQRRAAIDTVTERSKYLPPPIRHAVIEHLDILGGHAEAPGLMLTRDMILNLDREGVEVGAHTVTHPILTSLDDDSARREIANSKQQLENILGKPVRLFAYPNGKAGKDYDQRHVGMVRQAGFEAAFTTEVSAIRRGQDRFQLPRSRPWDTTPLRFGLRLLHWLAQGQDQ